MSPDISVVIPCRNGEATLPAQLDALVAQVTTARFEIVVANNGSTDRTAEVVAGYAGAAVPVRMVDASRRAGENVARNDGIRGSVGRFIILCDADDVVDPGWVEEYWRAFQRGVECAGGTLRRTKADGSVRTTVSVLQRMTPDGPPLPIAGANCGFTRAVFDAVGGFDESLSGAGEEIEFFLRAAGLGHRTELLAWASIRYNERATLRDAYRQQINYGRGMVRLQRKYRSEPGMSPRSVSSAALHTASAGARTLLAWPSLERRRYAVERLGHAVGEFRELRRRSG